MRIVEAISRVSSNRIVNQIRLHDVARAERAQTQLTTDLVHSITTDSF